MKRPGFSKPKVAQPYGSPEELFAKLPNRKASHGYLRAPQVDALREYLAHVDHSDVAMELPTGTGKTVVGLLIAEWIRRKANKRVAFLSVTNQLAQQVLSESNRLGISCADLRGDKNTRSVPEQGRFLAADAVGVTTYSNLFNVNPVISECDLIIFDDAHGGETFVASMWTVTCNRSELPELFVELMACLRPSLSDEQYRVVTDESGVGATELCDTTANRAIEDQLTKILDSQTSSLRYAWRLIRGHLSACLILVSRNQIVIRPAVPPTHTHAPFHQTRQRIYMSATLGGEGDLKRAYGVTNIKTIQAQHPQWGKRYIFAPALTAEPAECMALVGEVWSRLPIRRALALTPSFVCEQDIREEFALFDPKPTIIGSRDIEDSLDPFVQSSNAILTLAGRYDGVDLPGDDCRLLVFAESPGAVGSLERYQKECWKLGPLMRRRERTRLIQGMGRCTRDATDFAVIVLLGQSMIDCVTSTAVTGGLPPEVQRELRWGMAQKEVARESLDPLIEMILGLITDPGYRAEANESIESEQLPEVADDPIAFDESATAEVQFGKAMWSGNYTTSIEIARNAADQIHDQSLAGYRAWWLFLESLASRLTENVDSEIDCLKRARAIGINSGFLDRLLRKKLKDATVTESGSVDSQVEAIWNHLDKLGWHGPRYQKWINDMAAGLSSPDRPTQFHMGVEALGSLLGAESVRPTEAGAPDVFWVLSDRCYAFEAKSDKSREGSISKKEVLQAKGHPAWIRNKRPTLQQVVIWPLMISATSRISEEAVPHAADLGYPSIEYMQSLGKKAITLSNELRAEFAGSDFAKVRVQVANRLRAAALTFDALHGEMFSAD